MKNILLILTFFFFRLNLFAQTEPLHNYVSVFSGLHLQSTVIRAVTFRPLSMNYGQLYPFSYNYEKNVQSINLNLGIRTYIKKINLGFEYSPNFRYGYICGNINTGKDIYGFISDHHIGLFRHLAIWNSSKKKRHDYVGVGYSMMNMGKVFFVNNPPAFVGYLNLQFPMLSVYYGIPIAKHLYIEPRVSLITKNFPIEPRNQFIVFGLKMYYENKLF